MVWGCGVISLALPIVPTTKLPTKWCYATQLPTNRCPHSGKSWLIWLIVGISIGNKTPSIKKGFHVSTEGRARTDTSRRILDFESTECC